MNLASIPPLFSSLAFIAFGAFVYFKNRRSCTNFTFFLICVTTTLWQWSWTFLFNKPDEPWSGFLVRIGYSGIVFLPVVYFHFIVAFLDAPREKSLLAAAYLTASLLLAALWMTDLFINGYRELSWGYYPRAGLLHPLYLAMVLVLAVRGLALFVGALRTSVTFHRKNQIKYLTWALLIYLPAASDFLINYEVAFYPFGFVFITGFLFVTGTGIVKHQLLDIEIVIRRATVFAGLFAFTYAVFAVFTVLGQRFFEAQLGWNIWTSIVPTIAVITLALRPLENFLTNVTEKYLFQKEYSSRELLKTFASEVLTVVELQKLLDKTVEGLNGIIKLESCGVLLLNPATNSYELKAAIGVRKDVPVVFSPEDTLVYYLNASHGPIQKDEDIKRLKGKGSLSDDFKRLQAELCLPIILHDKLVGFISLGRKKSGENYNQEDIDVLTALAATEAVALSNAQMFVELLKTQAEAAQSEKMAVIGTLSAGINHEVCNPLGIARGQCEMFLLNCEDGVYRDTPDRELVEKSRVIFGKVIKEIDRATAITKRLSSFAKPSGFLQGEVSVAEEVGEVLAILGHELKLDNIEIVTQIPETLPKILADKKQIEEIIFNIVRNAGQAITGRGSIMISARENGERVLIEMRDTGGGIPPDRLNEIFNPFYTTKAPGKGTGLGLFIVKQIVERNRGTIAVESAVGVGTKFTLGFETALRAPAAAA